MNLTNEEMEKRIQEIRRECGRKPTKEQIQAVLREQKARNKRLKKLGLMTVVALFLTACGVQDPETLKYYSCVPSTLTEQYCGQWVCEYQDDYYVAAGGEEKLTRLYVGDNKWNPSCSICVGPDGEIQEESGWWPSCPYSSEDDDSPVEWGW